MRLPGGGMSWKEFSQALKLEATRDNLTDWAGAVTYAGVMALFPLLLFLVALASLVITTEQAEQLVQQLGAASSPSARWSRCGAPRAASPRCSGRSTSSTGSRRAGPSGRRAASRSS